MLHTAQGLSMWGGAPPREVFGSCEVKGGILYRDDAPPCQVHIKPGQSDSFLRVGRLISLASGLSGRLWGIVGDVGGKQSAGQSPGDSAKTGNKNN